MTPPTTFPSPRIILTGNHLANFLLQILLAFSFFAPTEAFGKLADSVVTFNEIHYHPSDFDDAEWIELHNQMSVRVDLSGWSLSGGVEYTFPEGSIMEPGAYWLVSSDPTISTETSLNVFGPFDGKLSNSGESLFLKNREGRLMDLIEYEDDCPWPVAPDGSGATLAKIDPTTVSQRAENWTWSQFEDGTPNQPNHFQNPKKESLRINEIASALEQNTWIEIQNINTESLNLENFSIGNIQLPNQTIAANGHFLITSSELGYAPKAGDLLVLKDSEGAIIQAIKVEDKTIAYHPLYETWQYPSEPTPNASNKFDNQTAIVINEIHYHDRPVYPDPLNDVEYSESDFEWIEFHNRSDQTVDLTGWTLRNAVEFDFPQGTQISPNGFLVVDDSEFSGGLSNGSERIELLDAKLNIADTVEYFDDYPWPKAADGNGSSLELIHPLADNNLSSSWAASDESGKSNWKTISYRGIASSPRRSNNPNNFNEFLMGMLDSGEVLIDDISVIEDPDGDALQLIQNGDFEQDLVGSTPAKWRILGNHQESHIVSLPQGGKALRIVATGTADHSYNLASTTFSGNHQIDPTKTYEISFRANWISSSPQLNTRLYFNRLARTHILPQPSSIGTPGKPNSTQVAIAPPSITHIRHSPLIPQTNESVNITANLDADEGIANATVFYNSGNGWQQVAMSEDSNTRYQATLPGQPEGTIVQFYIEANTENGGTATNPKNGAPSAALFRVGDRVASDHSGHRLRIIMAPEVVEFMHMPHHTVSEYRYQTTVINNDSEVWYDAQTRLRGSPNGRKGARRGWNIKFPADHLFRGVHETISVDGGYGITKGDGSGFLLAGAGVSTNELIYNQIAHRSGGIPASYDDIAYIEAPLETDDKLAQLKLARFGKIWKESSYPDGNDGTSFKFELLYYPVTTIDGDPESLKTNFSNIKHVFIRDMGEDKEAYRYNFEIQNNKDRDDYTPIIEAGKALVNTQDLKAATDHTLEIDNWLRVLAFQVLTATVDGYSTYGNPHNMLLYRPPYSSKTIWIPWDVDFAFFMDPTWSIFGPESGDFTAVVQLPANRRRYAAHLLDLCYTGFDPTYITDWINHFNDVGEQPQAALYIQWIKKRRDYVLQELEEQYPQQPFSILTNRGLDFTSNQSSVDLVGTAWLDVDAIRIAETGQLLAIQWSASGEWEATLPLTIGQNELTLVALNSIGEQVATDHIKITNTSATENASADNLVVSEIMYHPSDPSETEIAAGFDDNSYFEYLELLNIGPHAIDLTNLHFTDGIDFDFTNSPQTELSPGHTLLIALNKSAFALRYGDQHSPIGEFSEDTKLSDGGEIIRIKRKDGQIVINFEYDDKSPWPEEADGAGTSLELIDPFSNPDPSNYTSWKKSPQKHGNPGINESTIFDGNPFEDTDHDGYADYLNFLFGGSGSEYTPKLTLENGAIILSHHRNLRLQSVNLEILFSTDLENWTPVDLELINEKTAGNGTSLLRWIINDPSEAKFVKIRAVAP